MKDLPDCNRPFQFGDVTVDPQAHLLLRAGQTQSVEPKAFAVLLVLLSRPGALISRDELIDQVWGHRHVTSGVLTRAVAQLRNALGDDPQRPRYIQTKHSVGYRFIGVLEPAAAPGSVDGHGSGVESSITDGARPDDTDAMQGQAATASAARDQTMVTATAAAHRDGRPALPARRRGSWWLEGAIGLLVAAVLIWNQVGQRPLVEDSSIAIMPFTNLGDDRANDYFVDGLALEMHDALVGVKGLKVAANMTRGSALAKMDDVKALGQKLGVATVLNVSVRRQGERIRIHATLSDTRTGFTLWSHGDDRALTNIFDMQREIARDVVTSLLGAPAQGERAWLDRRLAPTGNARAFDAYLMGLVALDGGEQGGGGQGAGTRALQHFNKALQIDHGFARAQAGICIVEAWRYQIQKIPEAFDNARIACLRAQNMDPAMAEVNIALGDLYWVKGDVGTARDYFRKAEDDPGQGMNAKLGLADLLSEQGRQDEARAMLDALVVAHPTQPVAHLKLGYQLYRMGDAALAADAYKKAVDLKPDNAEYWSHYGGMLINVGKYAAAEQALETSVRLVPDAIVFNNLASLKYQVGKYPESVALYRKATTLDPLSYLYWGGLGDALSWVAGEQASAGAAYQRALELVRKYRESEPNDPMTTVMQGWYMANLGDEAAAARLVGHALASKPMPEQQAEIGLVAAETYIRLDDVERARASLAKARAAGLQEGRVTSSPLLREAGLVSAVTPDPARR